MVIGELKKDDEDAPNKSKKAEETKKKDESAVASPGEVKKVENAENGRDAVRKPTEKAPIKEAEKKETATGGKRTYTTSKNAYDEPGSKMPRGREGAPYRGSAIGQRGSFLPKDFRPGWRPEMAPSAQPLLALRPKVPFGGGPASTANEYGYNANYSPYDRYKGPEDRFVGGIGGGGGGPDQNSSWRHGILLNFL
ncbi:unnamed protein product [Gongylonema pulchrum]|uniref:Uncharacterized protein n=1 Tax=Gongylonema pulchrum TaxID=637853 RepID=A0A3P6QER0_9BILA|nr:unnamed protein product [Gongylonema pulchrum]